MCGIVLFMEKQGTGGKLISGCKGAGAERLVNELLAIHCMPTLLHVKPATLIAVDRQRIADGMEFLDILYHMVQVFHCELYLLAKSERKINFLIYEEALLNHCLESSAQMQFLSRYGYEYHEDIVYGTLLRLKERYGNSLTGEGIFPHEIGVILGYPVGDVEGFIINHGKNYLFSGVWKVYQDAAAARRTFAEYQEMRHQAVMHLEVGGTLDNYKSVYIN